MTVILHLKCFNEEVRNGVQLRFCLRSVFWQAWKLPGPLGVLTQLHEQSQRRRTARTSVRPKNHVILVGIAPAFEKVEKEVSGFDINVPSIGSTRRTVSSSIVTM